VGQSKTFTTLLVEDNDVFREMIKETLNSKFARMEIIAARDGPETLQIVETFQSHTRKDHGLAINLRMTYR
jgi:CheY-like chemotaxis protein